MHRYDKYITDHHRAINRISVTIIPHIHRLWKSIDSVNRDCIWVTIRNRGMPNKLINMIKEGYNRYKCWILHDGRISDEIQDKNRSYKRFHTVTVAFPDSSGWSSILYILYNTQ